MIFSYLPGLAGAVSIPIGFSQALQLPMGQYLQLDLSRFNPYRVFSGLATSPTRRLSIDAPTFQSLSGFLRPCNQGVLHHRTDVP